MHCDLDLGGMTLGEGHDTPLGHGQQLCEILSRSNISVRSYGPDMDFGYVCTVTLTLEMTLGEGHDTPLAHGQQLCVILSRSQHISEELWPRTRILGMCAL